MAEKGEPLSDRELGVLNCLAGGATNREIAQELDISPNTVKVHLRNIFTKLGVSSRTEATTVAIQTGVLTLPDSGPEDSNEEAVSQSSIPLENQGVEGQSITTQEQTPNIQWRWIVFALFLIIALLAGAIIGNMLIGNESPNAVAGQPTTTVEPFITQAMGETDWFVDRHLPQERANMALASIGLDLYLIGGEVEAGVINLVDVFETDSHQWHSASTKPTAVADVTGAVLFGEIFVPGGRLADERPTAVVEAYSPSNNAWRPVAPLPMPIAGGLTLSDDNLLYLIGGWDGQGYLSTIYAYDPEADSWKELPPMKYARAMAAGGVIDNRLYVVGGWDGERELPTCEYFDVETQNWHDCPPMILPRAGAGATVLSNNLLYVIGGGIEGEVSHAEVFNVNAGIWREFEMPMLEDGSSWHNIGVTSVETRIYALGGRQNETILSDNYLYEPFTHRTFLPTVGGDG
ncbi:MAG: kelch repeat-containing protein [Chloroflexota bacterium]|jgi:DNA-binding CsgD family transcriptional regulator